MAGNIFWIGEDVIYMGDEYHVQDTDSIELSAKIGKVDCNHMVWDPFWVPFSMLLKKEG